MQVRIIIAILTFSLFMMAMTAAYISYLEGPFPINDSSSGAQTSRAAPPPSSQEAAPLRQEEQPVSESPDPPRARTGQRPLSSREPVQSFPLQKQEPSSAPSGFPEEEEPPAESYSRRSTISWPEKIPDSPPASSQPSSSSTSSQPESSLPVSSGSASSEPASSEPEPPTSSESVSSEPASSLPASSEASSEAASSEPEASEPAASEPVSSDLESSEPEGALEEEIGLLCQELSVRYELHILILYGPEEDPDGWAEEYAADLQTVRDALDALERALSRFPEGFFHGEMTVYIAERFSSAEPDMRRSFVSCEGASSLEISRRLAACTAAQFLEEGDYSELADWNPSDFIYGVDNGYNEYYIFSEENPYNSYFLSPAGQESPEQDLEEILTVLLLDPDRLLLVEPGFAFYDKLSYCCRQLTAWRSELSDAPGLRPFLPQEGARMKWKRSG